ncbi:hypothetical protein [Riemerella columbipharyngis]|uniref:Uncharacterized protein n=1 Tax=Riemerella columbipharyngis TaxID=1071918 RepID=A0A1G7B7I3_9FLAO|nr:hypothetical protein [Riemerella columbipharyngis]SDE22922.1 hypothetical protein SAMN05421544_10556 [Riemerella columbipharyngis]
MKKYYYIYIVISLGKDRKLVSLELKFSVDTNDGYFGLYRDYSFLLKNTDNAI